jgi:enamine deaminase RidA (YjgF/YER057c/UK114 family)
MPHVKAEIVNPASLGAPRGYSNGVVLRGGGVLFVAGQIGWDAERRIVGGGFVAQFARALANVMAVVAEAGGTPESVGRLTIYVTNRQEYMDNLKEVGAAYRGVMGRHFPAMALVQVAALLEAGALVEIEATAVVA